MTQNTHTTAEKIETWQRVERMMDSMLVVEHSEPYPHEDGTMGGEYSDYVYDEDHKFRNLIAAEIDALTRERDEARAELAGLDAGMRFQFDRAEDYKAQRDEARAELLKEREAYSKRAAEQTVSGASKLMIAELAEARAEVERLRPAAEAWEARYRWGKTIDGTAESVKAQIAMEDAEDQAAAAKEAKP